MNLLLIIHCAVTWALVGLIWTVQWVIYPLFPLVGSEAFGAYHERHMTRITWLVAPLALMEFITAGWLLWDGMRIAWFMASLIPLGTTMLSTAFVQIPLHLRLGAGFDSKVYQALVATNRWRTAGWSIRGLCVVLALAARF